MPSPRNFKKVLERVQIVRPPKHRLSTFGNTQISYLLVTDVPGLSDRSRLRTGELKVERPAILTAQALQELFIGFSTEAQSQARKLVQQYGDAVRGLQYQFKNEPASTSIELQSPEAFVHELAGRYDREAPTRTALIRGDDRAWELALMKFIVEETLSSFTSNVRELEERGMFNREARARQRIHDEIDGLFRRAKADSAVLPLLGRKLREYGLFERYQDQFFRLVSR